ncbi:uncharacterized protein [Chelonus insularis]|uniref:uncharacterized protein n=1 Tax=Chelonus insularis TaxID=460826 RepID=UPI00158F52AD|nr:uncharacterized protein LOC118073205 [Chelonus insularis]
MTKYQIFNILFTNLIFFCINNILAGENEKFVLHSIEDATPPNEWMKLLSIYTHDEQYVTLSTEVYKEFPADTVIRTNVTYAGESFPQHEMLLCDSFNEKLFGDDVKQCGFPQPGFPQQCPFGPHKFLEVKQWKFPQYKIPDGTFPGSVIVNITFSSGPELMLKVNAAGEVVQKLYSTKAPMSLG